MITMAKNKEFIVGMFLAILMIVGTLATIGLIKLGIAALLENIGIQSEALQYIVIIALVIIIFVIMGVSAKKTLKKLIS